MKKIILILIIVFAGMALHAQQTAKAHQLVQEGVALHDKNDYATAISKYDEALAVDKDNLMALAEKAYTLMALKQYDESIKYCKRAIESHPNDKGLSSVYVTYGNDWDNLKNSNESLLVYNEGLEKFPDYFMLHFNKGVTLVSRQEYDDAILSLQSAITCNPGHPGSHNLLGYLLYRDKKRIPALMAYCRFLVLEPLGNRAKDNLARIQKIMGANVEKTGPNSISINIPSDMLDEPKKKKAKENNFRMIDMMMSMDAALDYDSANEKKTTVQKFIRKFGTVCSSLQESKKESGFYWKYYAPYFAALKDNNMIEAFVYTIFSSSGDEDVAQWLSTHKSEVDKLNIWSRAYNWKMN